MDNIQFNAFHNKYSFFLSRQNLYSHIFNKFKSAKKKLIPHVLKSNKPNRISENLIGNFQFEKTKNKKLLEKNFVFHARINNPQANNNIFFFFVLSCNPNQLPGFFWLRVFTTIRCEFFCI